jgi:hypothetical protein
MKQLDESSPLSPTAVGVLVSERGFVGTGDLRQMSESHPPMESTVFLHPEEEL